MRFEDLEGEGEVVMFHPSTLSFFFFFLVSFFFFKKKKSKKNIDDHVICGVREVSSIIISYYGAGVARPTPLSVCMQLAAYFFHTKAWPLNQVNYVPVRR